MKKTPRVSALTTARREDGPRWLPLPDPRHRAEEDIRQVFKIQEKTPRHRAEVSNA